jgi:hypothetical protein
MRRLRASLLGPEQQGHGPGSKKRHRCPQTGVKEERIFFSEGVRSLREGVTGGSPDLSVFPSVVRVNARR